MYGWMDEGQSGRKQLTATNSKVSINMPPPLDCNDKQSTLHSSKMQSVNIFVTNTTFNVESSTKKLKSI
jgi:hypothetical protein